MKLLVVFLALVALANAAPSSSSDISYSSSFIQYLNPVRPSDAILRSHGLGINAVFGKCPTAADHLKFCQTQFATDLQQPNNDIFTDPIKFAELVNGYYKLQVADGVLKLCAAQSNFRTCLGDYYTLCTDALQIFQDQLNDINKAFILAGVYDDIEFDCGGGLTQGIANWQCIASINNKNDYLPKVKACYDTYNKTISANPTNYDVFCTAGQILSVCIANVYRDLDDCGPKKNVAVQWWACERANRRVKLEGYCHPNTCNDVFPKPTDKPKTVEDEMEIHRFFESGGHYSEAKHRFFKLAGLPRGQRKLANLKN